MSTAERTKSIQIFRAEDAPSLDDDGMMSPPTLAKEVKDEFDTSPLYDGQRVNVLFKGEGADGFSLVHAWFGPGFRLPRHSHNADCLYYVIKGSAIMGTRVLGPGDGFFVKADGRYTYTAGPDGIEILEFRSATTFDMTVYDQTVASWRPIMQAAKDNHEAWLATTATSGSAQT